MIKTKLTQPIAIATIATIIAIASFPGIIFSVPTAKIVAQEVEPIKKSPDQVIRWNAIALEIIKAEKTSAPMAAHNLAMVHAAVYDAVNAISPTYQPYQVKQKAFAKTSKEAAAVTAAYYVLSQLYPNQVTNLNTKLDASLQEIPTGESKTQGIEFGKSVAEQIVKWRQDDGSTSQVTYIPINKPGYWQPVPPDFKSASMTHWQNVKPFAMRSNSQFRINKMPSLTSAEYAKEFNYTKTLGEKQSSKRTEDQTAIALFWLDNPGTVTPAGHWNQIAATVATRQGKTLLENARLFALLNIALADATIIDANQKYTFNRWRPITAIQQADKDDNPQTTEKGNWTPLVNTPSSPAYVSGHSTQGGAVDVVLIACFGKKVNFTTNADPTTKLAARSFTGFTEAAEEAGMSRIYAGAHWLSDNRDGLTAGRNLGNYVMQNFLLPQ